MSFQLAAFSKASNAFNFYLCTLKKLRAMSFEV
jgi:hypothetical protein